MKKYNVVLFALALLASCGNEQKNEGVKEEPAKTENSCSKYQLIDSIGKRIQFEKIPATNILYSEYKGSYQKHPEAFPKLMEYAFKNYKPVGACIGLYPQDPDVTPENELQWQVGIRVLPIETNTTVTAPGKDPFDVNASNEELGMPLSKLKKPLAPFELKTLPPVEAISVTTIVEKAGSDGLAMNAWLTINGYVQTGTTRMEFAMEKKDPMKIPVKISIPVVKRKTGLSLITADKN